MQKESEFQKELLAWLKKHGIEHWRMPLGAVIHRGGAFGKNPLKGFPDIMGILTKAHPGRTWALELKRPNGVVSPEQAAWLARLKMAGAAVGVVRNLPEALVFFRDLGEIE